MNKQEIEEKILETKLELMLLYELKAHSILKEYKIDEIMYPHYLKFMRDLFFLKWYIGRKLLKQIIEELIKRGSEKGLKKSIMRKLVKELI